MHAVEFYCIGERGWPFAEDAQMGGFIVLEDGRALAPNNWAYDNIIEAIAEELSRMVKGEALASWLLEQRCIVKGPGLGLVDVRELTTYNQGLFRQAAKNAIATHKLRGSLDWEQPEFYLGWINMFEDLVGMWASIDEGEPPQAFSHLTAVIEPTGDHAGPGWDAHECPAPPEGF